MQTVALLLCGIHLSYAATHSLQYFYTAVSGGINFPEFTVVGLVDNGQFMYFDSNAMKAVPKTEWMRQNEGADYWDRETQSLIGSHQVYKNNIQVAKERFNQSTGVHTVQRMLGCEWDDETGTTNGFFQDGYDGEDFLNLDLKHQRWISSVQQGFSTKEKWNNDKAQLDYWNQYLNTECIEWLKKYLQFGKSSLEKTVSPQVSLLQKDSSSPVTCHATGFYPSGVTITWMKNGEEHHEDVELGELLPNEDGTFQKTSTLTVTPDEWKNNKFSCLVEHKGINKEESEIRTNNENDVPIGIIVGVGVVAAVVLLAVIGGVCYMVNQKKKGLKPINSSKPINISNSGSDCLSNSGSDCLSNSDSDCVSDSGSDSSKQDLLRH